MARFLAYTAVYYRNEIRMELPDQSYFSSYSLDLVASKGPRDQGVDPLEAPTLSGDSYFYVRSNGPEHLVALAVEPDARLPERIALQPRNPLHDVACKADREAALKHRGSRTRLLLAQLGPSWGQTRPDSV